MPINQIYIKDVIVSRGNKLILEGVNFTFNKGESYSVTGDSGSGKSSLIHCISGFLRPISGNVYWDNVDIYRISDKKISEMRNRFVGFVHQESLLIKNATVLENTILSTVVGGGSLRKAKKRALDLLKEFELGHLAYLNTNHLSGGEKHRISIIRALLMEPSFVIADEPTGNLDKYNSEIVMEQLKVLKNNGSGIIVVTHDDMVARSMERAFEIKTKRTPSGVQNRL